MTTNIKTDEGSFLQFFSVLSFIKNFPMNTPIFLTCSYPNHGDVRMLVTPRYYHNSCLRCQILAVSFPLIPKGYTSKSETHSEIDINIYQIISWEKWEKKKGFLNFGTGYITERYLEMAIS